ncbi:MAG TPA: copper resistance CopC family protein [Mycobacteriales bacterium]|jgi:methionine-rich copper-binding protein CopC|nr:copper resistance CopC family protein [Mycobacteriales bacterium]
MLRRLVVAALLGVAISVLAGAPASAHDRLVSSSPAEGASVPAPSRVELDFSDVVLNRFGELAVTGPDGRRYDRGTPRIVDRTISVDLLPLPLTGRYTAAYRIVSSDGHPVSGRIGFTVTEAVPGATEPPPPSPSTGTVAATSSGLLPTVAVVVVVALLVTVVTVIRRRRRVGDGP